MKTKRVLINKEQKHIKNKKKQRRAEFDRNLPPSVEKY